MALNPGNYACYFVEQGIRKTSQGKQFIRFAFEVVAFLPPDGTRKERKEGAQPIYGELLFWLTDKAFDNTLRDVARLLGAPLTSFTQLDPHNPNRLSALNKEHELTLREEEYQGKKQLKWALAREMGTPLSSPELETLDERLKAKSAAVSGPADLPGADFPAADITDEDLPF